MIVRVSNHIFAKPKEYQKDSYVDLQRSEEGKSNYRGRSPCIRAMQAERSSEVIVSAETSPSQTGGLTQVMKDRTLNCPK